MKSAGLKPIETQNARSSSACVPYLATMRHARSNRLSSLATHWLSSILIIERENSEACEPMLAHVIAGNMGKARGQMVPGGFGSKGAPIVAFRQGIAERAPAPGPAEIEPVEMSNLAVRAVGDGRGPEISGGNRRRMHSASIKAEDWKSSPLGQGTRRNWHRLTESNSRHRVLEARVLPLN